MRAETLVLSPAAGSAVRRILEEAYPFEGCGVLIGEARDGRRIVARAEPAANRWEGREDRYRIDPALLAKLVADEDEGGPRVLGFFHSHPDAPGVPSPTDLDHAWPWYHYLIVPVYKRRAGPGRVWELVDGGFVERGLVDGEDAAPGPQESKEATWRE